MDRMGWSSDLAVFSDLFFPIDYRRMEEEGFKKIPIVSMGHLLLRTDLSVVVLQKNTCVTI